MRATWIVPPERLIEPALAPEFYIDRVGAIEKIGDCIRVYYCAEQISIEEGAGRPQKIVMVKLVRPIAAIPDAISRMARCLAAPDSAVAAESGPWPRLVR